MESHVVLIQVAGTMQALLGGEEIYHYHSKLMMKEVAIFNNQLFGTGSADPTITGSDPDAGQDGRGPSVAPGLWLLVPEWLHVSRYRSNKTDI
jgi:hypothetical protein